MIERPEDVVPTAVYPGGTTGALAAGALRDPKGPGELQVLLNRLRETVGHFRENNDSFIQMNTRLMGAVPAEVNSASKFETSEVLIDELRYTITTLEYLAQEYGQQLERLRNL